MAAVAEPPFPPPRPTPALRAQAYDEIRNDKVLDAGYLLPGPLLTACRLRSSRPRPTGCSSTTTVSRELPSPRTTCGQQRLDGWVALSSALLPSDRLLRPPSARAGLPDASGRRREAETGASRADARFLPRPPPSREGQHALGHRDRLRRPGRAHAQVRQGQRLIRVRPSPGAGSVACGLARELTLLLRSGRAATSG